MSFELNEHKETKQIWYSFQGVEYSGEAPWFYDTSKFEWVTEFETKFDIIRKEIERLVEENGKDFVPYFNSSMVDKENAWKTLIFYFWGQRKHKVIDRSPVLDGLFQSIPGFISAAVSKLEAGTEIDWHPGDTSGIIRCHFPIKVPGGLPDCGFQVEDEIRAWEEGKMLMFCDANRHRAFNLTNEDRIILIIDIIRPEFTQKKRAVAANALSILWLQRFFIAIPMTKRFPKFFNQLMRQSFKVIIYLYLPIQRKFKSL